MLGNRVSLSLLPSQFMLVIRETRLALFHSSPPPTQLITITQSVDLHFTGSQNGTTKEATMPLSLNFQGTSRNAITCFSTAIVILSPPGNFLEIRAGTDLKKKKQPSAIDLSSPSFLSALFHDRTLIS